jgi:two-component system CheB/CheR fusion protein
VLFLGSAESIGGFTELFAPVAGKSRLFHRKEAGARPVLVEFPSAFVATPLVAAKRSAAALPAASLQTVAEQWLLQTHAPAAVLCNDAGDIVFISGSTGRYLEPAAGKANWNIFVMAREGLRAELAGAFQQARSQPEPVVIRGLKPAGGGLHDVDLTVQFLAEPKTLAGLAMIVFTEVPAAAPVSASPGAKPVRSNARYQALELKFQQARAEAQATREAMQTTQEELKSMNEELQSTNEELQSTNEELTTSKEEMQSLNEELQTVNGELQAKVDELSTASNDMKNLLNSTEIATLFLDNALGVRRFTESTSKIIKLIPGDVGRPITDLASDLLYPELAADAREVLRTLVPVGKPIATRDGRWFAMRLMPYRTMDNRIDGVVITFADITVAKKLEAELRARPGAEK